MKKIYMLLALCAACCTVSSGSLFAGDREAMKYVRKHPTTYIAIVWPRAYPARKYIRKELASCGHIVHTKTFQLSEVGVWNFFKNAHRSFPTSFMKKALKNYLSGCKPPFTLRAYLLHTDLPVKKVIGCKKRIRKKLGMSYWSLHINDTYQETIEMAEVLYHSSKLKAMNELSTRGLFLTDPFLY